MSVFPAARGAREAKEGTATAEAHGTRAAAASHAHIASLDAVRGIAVLLVLVFHFGWTFTTGNPVTYVIRRAIWVGWVGVDLFFALSGFLITRGLIATSALPTKERMRLFWTRRFLRIFPLYYAVLIVGAIACYFLGVAPPSLSYWLYFQNYAIAFDPMSVIRWTSHFWSLAIEEQFYLFWPVLMLLARPKQRVPITLGLLGFGLVVRTVVAMMGPRLMTDIADVFPKLVYCATPMHMDGLLLGALVSMLVQDPEHPIARAWKKLRAPAMVAAYAAAAVLAVVTQGFSPYDRRVAVIGYPLLAFAFASTIYALVDRPAGAPALWPWRSRALQSCGKISYGMYVLHWPISALLIVPMEAKLAALPVGAAAAVGTAIIVVGTLVSYALAWLSFRYFEQPFLKLKARFSG
jgi:peptidoglycan/LPS O-acetylase OafA/YrhL